MSLSVGYLLAEYFLQISHVLSIVLLHIAHVGHIAAPLHKEPSRPSHLVERTLHCRHVDRLVVAEPHSVGVAGMNGADVAAAELPQVFADVAVCSTAVCSL